MKKILYTVIAFALFSPLETKAETVILLHGFLGSSRTMKPIEKILSCSGFDVCVWDYPTRQRSIQDHAAYLVPLLQQMATSHPGEPIHFVGHSIAALVIRAALNFPECPMEAKIGKVVLIAPPNKGSELAYRWRHFWPVRFALGSESGRQLMCYDGYDIVRCFGPFPTTMEILVIAGSKGNTFLFNVPNDGYISVSETSLEIPYYWKCFPFSHGELLKCTAVLSYIRGFFLCKYPSP